VPAHLALGLVPRWTRGELMSGTQNVGNRPEAAVRRLPNRQQVTTLHASGRSARQGARPRRV